MSELQESIIRAQCMLMIERNRSKGNRIIERILNRFMRCIDGTISDWDKVERKKRPISFTKTDEYYEYFKMFLIVGLGVMYLWFIFSG